MVPAVAGNVSQSPKCYQGTFPPLPVTFHVVPGYALRESERERECVCVLCARTFASVLWARSSRCRSFRARLRPCPQRLSLGQECCGLWCDGLCARLLRPLDSSSFAGPRGVPPLGFFEGFGCESWPPCLPGHCRWPWRSSGRCFREGPTLCCGRCSGFFVWVSFECGGLAPEGFWGLVRGWRVRVRVR